MFKEANGDLIDLAKQGHFDVIIHGCNCFNTMGAGIAKRIKEEFPAAYVTDSLTRKGDRSKLGTITTAGEGNPGTGKHITVINAYTQYHYGRGTGFDIDAFTSAMKLIFTQYANSGLKIGMPLIGCGLAGGDWRSVKPILMELVPATVDLTVVHFQNRSI